MSKCIRGALKIAQGWWAGVWWCLWARVLNLDFRSDPPGQPWKLLMPTPNLRFTKSIFVGNSLISVFFESSLWHPLCVAKVKNCSKERAGPALNGIKGSYPEQIPHLLTPGWLCPHLPMHTSMLAIFPLSSWYLSTCLYSNWVDFTLPSQPGLLGWRWLSFPLI